MENLKWRTLESEVLFKDLWFTVRKDTCEASNGKIISPYYVYEFPDWVTALALDEEGKVIMVRQYRHALGEVCIEIPGGCIDNSDENPQQAIARELKEETGYEFSYYEYLGRISANPSTNNNIMHMFLATGGRKTSAQSLDDNEEIIIERYSIDEVKDMLRKNEILQAMHITTIMYGLVKLNELKC